MFSKKNTPAPKPQIQVLKVREEVRDVTETHTNHMSYSKTSETKKEVHKVSFTVVLFIKDGVLMTREFNGKWDLSDIKLWEEA